MNNLILPRRRLQKHTAQNLVALHNNGECPLAYLVGGNQNNLIREMGKYYRNQYPLTMSKQNVKNLITSWNQSAECPTVYMNRLTPQQERAMWNRVLKVYHESNPVNNSNLRRILNSAELRRLLSQKRRIKTNTNRLKTGLLRNKQSPIPKYIINHQIIPALNINSSRKKSNLKRAAPPRYRKYL
jgi:arylamine N-acetyltransferase